MFPPCKTILEQQTKRAWFITHLYKTVVKAYQAINDTSINFDWKLHKNHEYLEAKWFEGDHVPSQLELTDNTDVGTKESED